MSTSRLRQAMLRTWNLRFVFLVYDKCLWLIRTMVDSNSNMLCNYHVITHTYTYGCFLPPLYNTQLNTYLYSHVHQSPMETCLYVIDSHRWPHRCCSSGIQSRYAVFLLAWQPAAGEQHGAREWRLCHGRHKQYLCQRTTGDNMLEVFYLLCDLSKRTKICRCRRQMSSYSGWQIE